MTLPSTASGGCESQNGRHRSQHHQPAHPPVCNGGYWLPVHGNGIAERATGYYWDPWYGWQTGQPYVWQIDFTWNVGAGFRWNITDQLFIKATVGAQWLEYSEANGITTQLEGMFAIGWMF